MAKQKILIVEDEHPLAKALQLKLGAAGYDVVVCNDGESAIEAIKNESFSIVLLDLIMPTVDGFEVLETVKNFEQTPPIVVLSNLGQDEDITRAKSLGATDFFIKADTPIADIVARVQELLK